MFSGAQRGYGVRSHHGAAEERLHHQAAAEGLRYDQRFKSAAAEAAVLLRHPQSQYTEAREFVPDRGRVGGSVVRGFQPLLAGFKGVAVVQIALHAVGQQGLFFSEGKIHVPAPYTPTSDWEMMFF